MRRAGKIAIIVVAILLIAAILFFAWNFNRYQRLVSEGEAGSGGSTSSGTGDSGGGTNATGFDIATAIAAVAASENGKYDQALGYWEKLVAKYPKDADFQLNQAVTGLKWIADVKAAIDKAQDPQKQESLAKELEQAILKIESTIKQISQYAANDGRAALLQATFLENRSHLESSGDGQGRLVEAAEVLKLALDKNPAQPLLACKFDDIVQSLGGQDPAMNKVLADVLYASHKADSRNLCLIVRAMETLLAIEDQRIVELLPKSLELSQPFMSRLPPQMGKGKAEELINKVVDSIKNGQWRQAQVVRQWINSVRSQFNADVRLVKPDIMALLDTSFFNRYQASGKSIDSAKVSSPVLETRVLSESSQIALWYDFDIDLDFDVVNVDGNLLTLLKTGSDKKIASDGTLTLELPLQPKGCVVADLFEVDLPSRPKIASVADVASTSKTNATAQLTAEQLAMANRHDTIQELVLWDQDMVVVVTSIDTPSGRELRTLAEVPGLTGLTGVRCVEPTDLDSDGDLDLVIASSGKFTILQNNGNRTFRDISQYSVLPDPGFIVERLFAVDADHDLDQDVLIVGNQPGIYLLENILHSQFRFRKMDGNGFQGLSEVSDIACADLDGNASWDACAIGKNGLACVMTLLTPPGQWLGSRVVAAKAGGTRLQVCDLNNDAALDFIVAGDTGLEVFWGLGNAEIADVGTKLATGQVSNIEIQDANGDGNLDILTTIDGKATLLSTPAAQAQYLAVRVRGINDNNGGGRINHYAVGSTLELRSEQQMQARVIRTPTVHFGLASQKPLNLRIIFNNGLTQNDDQIKSNMLVEERQELKGSCPFVYGWDGQRFAMITDLLWNAPLGLQVARGKVLPDRRWEYLMLPGELVRPKEGFYQLQFTEELWELAYFDHIALMAVDHPADVDVMTNEKVGPAELAKPTVFSTRTKIFPKRVTDGYGRDLTNKMAAVDRNFAQGFQSMICQGYSEPHFVELDFGKLDVSQPLKLALHGWMHPTDCSLNIGLAQNEELSGPEPPSLWVVDQDGKWVCAQPFMGFPGGKPKTIVVDLASVFRSDDHRIRIGSSQQIYWDHAFVFNAAEQPEVRQIPLSLHSADLHYRGFGRLLPRTIDQPHWYDYEDVDTRPKWQPLKGPFTRYGDVTDLLMADDDRMIVMVAGDEFTARFSIPQDSLPEGWKRDFVLYNVGWDKDADLNTLEGDCSLPLPFKAMQAYPPPPDQEDTAAKVWQLNRDHLIRY